MGTVGRGRGVVALLVCGVMIFSAGGALAQPESEGGSGASEPGSNAMQACIAQVKAWHDARPELDGIVPIDRRPPGPPIAVDELRQRASGAQAKDRNAAAELVGRPVVINGSNSDLTVPPPGLIASMEATPPAGAPGLSVQVCNPGDGTLAVDVEQGDTTESAGAFSAGACSEPGYVFYSPHQAFGYFEWRYNNSGGQAHITAAEFASLTKSGFDRLLTGYNDCGFGDPIAYTAVRAGTTTRSTGGPRDGTYTMGWGQTIEVRPNVFAVAQTYNYTNNFNSIEFDVRYSNDAVNERLAESITSSCGHSFDFKSVALHEVMHGYGYKHVPNSVHLTMTEGIPPCNTSKGTLAYGDWDGIRDKYQGLGG